MPNELVSTLRYRYKIGATFRGTAFFASECVRGYISNINIFKMCRSDQNNVIKVIQCLLSSLSPP